MEDDTEGQVESRKHQQGSKPLQQNGHQANLKHVGVEQHQQNDDQVEQDANVLDAGEEKSTSSRSEHYKQQVNFLMFNSCRAIFNSAVVYPRAKADFKNATMLRKV